MHILLQSLVIYVENMLKLESGVFGELVRSTMLSGLVDLLLDLDVSLFIFFSFPFSISLFLLAVDSDKGNCA